MSIPLFTGNSSALGQPVDRMDGRLKVTGGVRYSAEFVLPGLAYGVLLTSTAPKSRMAAIDTTAVERAPGVHLVLTHLNVSKIPGPGGGGTRPKTPDTLTAAGPGLRSATITVRADK